MIRVIDIERFMTSPPVLVLVALCYLMFFLFVIWHLTEPRDD